MQYITPLSLHVRILPSVSPAYVCAVARDVISGLLFTCAHVMQFLPHLAKNPILLIPSSSGTWVSESV